ncbi:uncharacterized protein LOC134694439 [Mytilus trossulus]|uniref:uncharacterized protein LOC134694439 n=1 Tax=Mytilus trossulus TaxID=6551 RepID=UPI0030046962
MEKKDLKTTWQKTVRISTERRESLNYYKYLCQQIGSEEVVKMRRLALTMIDIGKPLACAYNMYNTITSGSKGEGLHFESSDFDIMFINPFFKVYEPETAVVSKCWSIPLIMNTEETQPCFTQLRLINHPLLRLLFTKIWEQSHLGCMLSSEQYKLFYLSIADQLVTNTVKIHGPCLTDIDDRSDTAMCLKCDQWIIQAHPWIKRPRKVWPSTKIISKIISCGVLFVPIGCKGSVNENLEWRISFSVAEKYLIFSFSHTQFLCYALLKILLKEIIEKHADLKGLLCSYYLKTLMFWISEETDSNVWRPDNIIPCFMACLQRLLYCVKYSNLSHYFIPENNFFYSRFNAMNKEQLDTILHDLYEQGINCLASSETLKDYRMQSYNITASLTSGYVEIINQTCSYFLHLGFDQLIHILLYYSRTGLCRGLLALHLSKACWFAPDTSLDKYSSENKHQYYKYKHDLSHLLIGVQSEAVSGWLLLASMFYVHKEYVASLTVINHAMQKYTDDKIFTKSTTPSELTFVQTHQLNLMKNEKLYTVLKTLTIDPLMFHEKSSIIPKELQLVVKYCHIMYPPKAFSDFLRFLCYYHLHDTKSCKYHFKQLLNTIVNSSSKAILSSFSPLIMCGIALQLMGEKQIARMCFQAVYTHDSYKTTKCAASSFLNLYSSFEKC